MHQLVDKLLACISRERSATAEVLSAILKVKKFELYREEGFSSLYEFLTKGAKYSEGSAMRRIQAVKVLEKDEGVLEKLRTGELSLCAMAELGRAMEEENAMSLIEQACNKSKRDVEKLVAQFLPPERWREEQVRPVLVERAVVPEMSEPETIALASVMNDPTSDSIEVASTPRTLTTTELCHELTFLADEKLVELIERARVYTGNVTLAKLMELGLVALLREKEPKSQTQRTFDPELRRIPKGLRHDVLTRAESQCEFVSEVGVRCTERCGLQVDHIVPFALGGRTEISNLRALCGTHNRFEAEKIFGKIRKGSAKDVNA